VDAADYEIAPLIEPRKEEGNKDRTMVLNMGPQHPSTHGVLRLVLRDREDLRGQVLPAGGSAYRSHRLSQPDVE
jgi:NADH:ubiquinone oxidoreductase subunit D